MSTPTVAWRHGWEFGRDAAGAVIVRKRDYGRDDVGSVLPADSPLPAPVLAEAAIPPAEFAAILAVLGDLGPIVQTPGVSEPARAVPRPDTPAPTGVNEED